MSANPERSPKPRRRPRMIRGASEQVAVQIQHYIHDEHLQPGDFLGREVLLAPEEVARLEVLVLDEVLDLHRHLLARAPDHARAPARLG